MSSQDEPVSVRLLPDGKPQPAICEGREGSRIKIALQQPGDASLNAGALVEVLGQEMLYLGEILGRQANLLIIAIEHAVNRQNLAAIQNAWQTQD